MISYVNVHAILDGRRNRAKASSSDASTAAQVLLLLWILFVSSNLSYAYVFLPKNNVTLLFVYLCFKKMAYI